MKVNYVCWQVLMNTRLVEIMHKAIHPSGTDEYWFIT